MKKKEDCGGKDCTGRGTGAFREGFLRLGDKEIDGGSGGQNFRLRVFGKHRFQFVKEKRLFATAI